MIQPNVLKKGERIMLFSSLIFVLLFLPVFIFVYHAVARNPYNIKGANIVLVLASLIFYLFGGLFGVLMLFVATIVGWAGGFLVDMTRNKPGVRKGVFAFMVFVLIAMLGFFKYAGFFSNIVMPVGMSFYIFKLISYVADCYNEKTEPEESFVAFLIYTACFHHVMQGPIIRYPDVKESIYNRSYTIANMSKGIYRFSLGLFKKAVLADHMGEISDILLPVNDTITSVPALGVWMGMFAYSMQLYLDFSAYSDMAIGLGQMIGFDYPENFNYPYISKSVKEFWTRWHISLSSFFKDYVYIPLGGNRKGEGRRNFNLFVVWLLTGIWHGATVNFIIWGLFYFVFIEIENYSEGMQRLPGFVKHLYTILVFSIGWLIFKCTNAGVLGKAFIGLFGINGNGFTNAAVKLTLSNNLFFIIICVLACTPLYHFIDKKLAAGVKKNTVPAGLLFGLRTVLSFAALIIAIYVMAGSSFRPFLYNQF